MCTHYKIDIAEIAAAYNGMKGVYMAKQKKRADGRFCKTFTFNGKKYFAYGHDKQEAERNAIEKLQSLEQGKKNHDNPLFKVFYEKWSDNRRGTVKEATLRSQQHHFNTISKIVVNGSSFGECRLADIKPDDIRMLQKKLLANGNSEQTVNDKIAFLSHIFHDAIKERYLDYNPCCPVKPLKRTDKRARDTYHRALTLEEQKRFFEAAKNSYYYNIYRLAVLTGMRIGEIGALYSSDIYDGMIHIERTVTRTQSGSYVIGEDTKTWHGKRDIPLNDKIKEVIEHQKSINRLLDGEKIISMNDTIFKARERGLLLATPVDRDIKKICREIGIEEITCHALRATFATRCIEQGMQPRTLQELLGHADFGLTMNLYGHVVDDTKEKAMQMVEIAL